MSMIARGTRLCTLLTAVLSLAACGDGTPVPSIAEPTSAVAFAGAVSTTLATVPTIRVTDDRGRGVKDVMVRWRVTAGGGKVGNDSVRTARDGSAAAGPWLLGTIAGVQTLVATADGVPPVTFTAQVSPGAVTQLNAVSSDATNPVVNTPLSPTPVVRAVDVFGNPVPGVPVVFSVTQGGGSVTGEQQVTNAQGLATVGAWRLGTRVGTQGLRASTAGAGAASFSVIAGPDVPVDLVKIAGDSIESPSGVPVGTPPGVRVVDAYGNGVGGVPVTFAPAANSGSVTTATVVSDPANGSAFVGSWTLGTQPVQSLIATSSRLPGRSVTFTATIVESAFQLEVRFVGSAPGGVQIAFNNAVARWKRLIIGRIHNIVINTNAGICGQSWIPAITETVRDVVIYARIVPIDGAGSILGQANVCLFNSRNNLPAVGFMEFDEDDMPRLISNGTLSEVILHEMGHVLGIGTMWNVGRSLLIGSGSSDPYFVGTGARTEFAALNTVTYGGNPVPIENTGGPGTRDSHWRENVLGRELMTGFINSGAPNPLSRLTVASLRDMGYQVNLNAADAFSFTSALYAFPFVEGLGLEMHRDVLNTPMFGINPDGTMTKRP